VSDLEANLRNVYSRVAAAAGRAGRAPAGITLVAVTKTQSLEVIRAAYDLGLRDFGENRVEEAEGRVHDLPDDITWHMIGHIQSRKAARVAPIFQFVHSVDSVKLARRLDHACSNSAEPLPVLLELNVTGEGSKYGFAADRWFTDGGQRTLQLRSIREITTLPNLRVCGLMTMAPIVTDSEEARPAFAHLRRVREDLAQAFPRIDWLHLSMGMTDDFEVAIEEGATLVRVGRAIFAPGLPAWRRE
jgi:pyridoxal phosphate enzyme (YggS family)